MAKPKRDPAPRRSGKARKNQPADHDALWGRVVWLGLLLAWAFLAASLLSFTRSDPPSDVAWPVNSPVHNWCGPAGAYIAYNALGSSAGASGSCSPSPASPSPSPSSPAESSSRSSAPSGS
ncbi:MAG: DNA translocase FtsK 4TM domain-containing protein [Phycisphaerales bacterium]|nr:DNA translocase FtsK 4TM domain-containing protein [Phycisphaerales bacterium]